MKKHLGFLAIGLMSIFASANIIEWNIESIEDSMGVLAGATDDNTVQFLNIASYSLDTVNGTLVLNSGKTADGSGTYYESFADGNTYMAAGTWEDSIAGLSPAVSYYLGVYDTSIDAYRYLASADGPSAGEAFVVTSDMLTASGALLESNVFQVEISTPLTFVAVPEPAVATLALAGIALLFRRRKNA